MLFKAELAIQEINTACNGLIHEIKELIFRNSVCWHKTVRRGELLGFKNLPGVR